MEGKEEQWLPVAGYEGFYEVSNSGNVRTVRRAVRGKNNKPRIMKPRVLKPNISTCGYYYVNLWRDNGYKSARNHRLVAEAFIPNPQGLPIINHIDGNKLNNDVSNLEWCNYSHNTLHAHRNGLTHNTKAVRNIETGEIFYSESEAARVVKTSQGDIGRAVRGNANGKYLMAGGYHWVFVDKEKAHGK